MPETIQSRFTVYARPDAPPGRCIVCGATQRPVIDFGVDVEWADNGYGRAYFCEDCITEAASKFPKEETPAADGISREEFDRWKLGFLNDVTSYAATYPVASDIVPVYGDPSSMAEQAESEHTAGTKSDKPAPRRLVVKTDESVVS